MNKHHAASGEFTPLALHETTPLCDDVLDLPGIGLALLYVVLAFLLAQLLLLPV